MAKAKQRRRITKAQWLKQMRQAIAEALTAASDAAMIAEDGWEYNLTAEESHQLMMDVHEAEQELGSISL